MKSRRPNSHVDSSLTMIAIYNINTKFVFFRELSFWTILEQYVTMKALFVDTIHKY